MLDNKCENCEFFVRAFHLDQNGNQVFDDYGDCRRYPSPVRCEIEYWCGEFVLKSGS